MQFGSSIHFRAYSFISRKRPFSRTPRVVAYERVDCIKIVRRTI